MYRQQTEETPRTWQRKEFVSRKVSEKLLRLAMSKATVIYFSLYNFILLVSFCLLVLNISFSSFTSNLQPVRQEPNLFNAKLRIILTA